MPTSRRSPRFEALPDSVTVILPVIGTRPGITEDEATLMRAMSAGRRYARVELDAASGFEKHKTIRSLNSLIRAGLVVAEGSGRARRYARA